MRTLAQYVLIGCFLVLPAPAQRAGGGHGGSGGGAHGGGGFHGGMGGGGFHGGMGGGFRGGGFSGHGAFRGPVNGFHGGFRGFRGFYGRYFPRNRFFYTGYYPFGYYPWSYWPYYSPSWSYPASYDTSYGYPYADLSYPTSNSDYGSAASPAVVIYQSQRPVNVYDAPAQPEQRQPHEIYSAQTTEKPIYLIAVKGQNTISAAQAYWVTTSTLHYVTLQGEQRQVSLNSIDRALTLRLNRDRHIDLWLPNGP